MSRLPQPLACSGHNLPALQVRIRRNEGVQTSEERAKHVRVSVPIRLRRELHVRKPQAAFLQLRIVHRAAKVSLLPREHSPDAQRADLACIKRLRGKCITLPRLWPKCLPDVFRPGAAAVERGASVPERHEAFGGTIQATPTT